MQALQGRRRRERLHSSPAREDASHPSHSFQRPETALFESVDLTSSSFPTFSPSPWKPPAWAPHSSSPAAAAEDWTTTLDAVVATPSSASSTYLSTGEAEVGRGKRTVRRARSTADWSTASSSSPAAGEEAWAAHLARQPPASPLPHHRRSLSLSLPPSSPSAHSFLDSPRPDSSHSRESRRPPSLPSLLPPRPSSAAVSWRGRHQSYTVVEVQRQGEEGGWKKLKGRGSTLSLKALMGVGGGGGGGVKEKMDERLLLPPAPVMRRKITKGSWEYQVTESLLHGGTPPPPSSRPPTRPPRQRPSLLPLTYPSTSPAEPTLLAPPPALLVEAPSASDLEALVRSPAPTYTRSSRSRSSSVDSSSTSLTFHSAASQTPFPILFPAQDPFSSAASALPPPLLHSVKSPARASVQYSIRATSLTRASFSSVTSLRPSLEPTCVIDLTILNDDPERTEAGTTVSFPDSGTVVIPFLPQSPLLPRRGGGRLSEQQQHFFPPGPPVPLSSRKQPKKLARVPIGAWLFVVGFVCPLAWWIGAIWPKVGKGKEEGRKGRRGSGVGEKGIEGGKEKFSPTRSSPLKYTNFPRSRLRSRTESAVSRLLDGSSTPSTPATQEQAAILVWRRRNRLASLASVCIVAAVVGFAAWGATK